MRSRLLMPTAAAALILAGCSGDGGGGTGVDPNPPGGTQPTTPVTSASVTAGSSSDVFTPKTVNLKVGGTVTWSFGGREHNVIFQKVGGAPADIPVTSNAQVSRTFNTAGSYPYDCTLHAGMVGTITVQ